MNELIGSGLLLAGIAVLLVIGRLKGSKPASAAPIAVPPPLPIVESDSLIFDQLERFAEAERIEDQRKRRTRIWLRPVGFVTRLMTYAALLLLLYINCPDDISHRPLGSLTLSEIIKTAFFIGAGLVLVRALFNPVDDETVRDAWGWLGVWAAAALGCAVLYFRSH
ncbi:hypothetical protein [Bradyrhizobium sp. STM 3561]|uniref:hypothetical protein n=1 Tax=Bradyrhizobium sp. STM 3561 TaxID=578923 RepID=UPI00388FC72B